MELGLKSISLQPHTAGVDLGKQRLFERFGNHRNLKCSLVATRQLLPSLWFQAAPFKATQVKESSLGIAFYDFRLSFIYYFWAQAAAPPHLNLMAITLAAWIGDNIIKLTLEAGCSNFLRTSNMASSRKALSSHPLFCCLWFTYIWLY